METALFLSSGDMRIQNIYTVHNIVDTFLRATISHEL